MVSGGQEVMNFTNLHKNPQFFLAKSVEILYTVR